MSAFWKAAHFYSFVCMKSPASSHLDPSCGCFAGLCDCPGPVTESFPRHAPWCVAFNKKLVREVQRADTTEVGPHSQVSSGSACCKDSCLGPSYKSIFHDQYTGIRVGVLWRLHHRNMAWHRHGPPVRQVSGCAGCLSQVLWLKVLGGGPCCWR